MIPSGSKMAATAKSTYGQKLGPEGEEYLKAILGAVEKAWDKWQTSLKWGGNTVNGAGVGAWSGSGSGGVMTGDPFELKDFSFKGNSPQQKKFTKALADALAEKFPDWVSSYKINGTSYTGTSGATPTAPGPVQAQSAATPLQAGGKGTEPSGIAALWKSALKPPDFDLNNPQCKSGKLMDAIAKTIENEFKSTWLLTAKLMGNSLAATGAPGGAIPPTTTPSDGTVV